MKARIPMQFTNKQKAAIRENVAQELRRQEQGNIRRVFKLLCASLHEEYGFGKIRCMRIIDRINKTAAEHEQDEVYWHHIDTLMEQLGIAFEREDYDKVDR